MRSREALKARASELADEIVQKRADFKSGRITDRNYYKKFVARLLRNLSKSRPVESL